MANDTLWQYAVEGRQVGPVPEAELRRMLGDRRLAPSTLVWRPGMTQWAPAGALAELAGAAPPGAPPVAMTYHTPPPAPVSELGKDPLMRMLLPVGRSGWAIAAGYLGLFSIAILPAPLALIISIVAIHDIKTHPNRHGMGRAIFGLVMGILGSIVLIFGFLTTHLSIR